MYRKLNYMDRPAAFTVCGKGKFPIDMLRHDVATPASEVDSNTIQQSGLRDVRLSVAKMRYVTPDRWRSFGWSVKDELTVIDD
jgi:hypothetical protein